jgi:hypothetical protein
LPRRYYLLPGVETAAWIEREDVPVVVDLVARRSATDAAQAKTLWRKP